MVRQLKLLTEEAIDASRLGRLIKGAIKSKYGHTFNLIVLYGWTGADSDHGKAERTDSLLQAAFLEAEATKGTPTLITGDLNGKVQTFPTLRDALENEHWIDLGATRHLERRWDDTNTGPTQSHAWPAANC